MNDADRLAQARVITIRRNAKGVEQTLYHGPTERQRCAKHPRNTETYRWTWWHDAGGMTPEEALENGDAEVVRGCSKCAAEDE